MTSLGSFQFQLFPAPGFSVLSIRSLWTQSWKDIRNYLVHIPYFTEEKPEAWRRSGISLPDITQFSRGPACVLVKLGDMLLQGLKAQERKHGSQLMATPPTHTLRLASPFHPCSWEPRTDRRGPLLGIRKGGDGLILQMPGGLSNSGSSLLSFPGASERMLYA